MKRTCDLRGCSLPMVIVLRWPWVKYPFRACAEHNQDLVAKGMVVHEDGATMLLAPRRKDRYVEEGET